MSKLRIKEFNGARIPVEAGQVRRSITGETVLVSNSSILESDLASGLLVDSGAEYTITYLDDSMKSCPSNKVAIETRFPEVVYAELIIQTLYNRASEE